MFGCEVTLRDDDVGEEDRDDLSLLLQDVLLLPTDLQRRAAAGAASCPADIGRPFACGQRPERGDHLGAALELDRRSCGESEPTRRGLAGRCAHDDGVERRRRFHALCDRYDVAHQGRLSSVRSEEIAGVDADAERQPQAVAGLERVVLHRDGLLHRERRPDRPRRIVRSRLRQAEHRHDRVADVLIDAAAMPLDLARERREVRAQHTTQLLRVKPLGEGC